MTWDQDLALLGGALCGVAAVLAPAVIKLTPEPPPDPEGDIDFEMTEPKELYADLARRTWVRPILILISALAGGALAGVVGESWLLLPALVFAVFGAMLGVIDVRTKYLPTALIVPLYGAALVAAVGASIQGSTPQPLLLTAVGWVIFGGFFTVLWLFAPSGGLGFGDVRLAGALGLILGLSGLGAVMLGLLATAISGGVVAVVGMTRGIRRFPYGPNLLLGGFVGMAFAEPFVRWYLD